MKKKNKSNKSADFADTYDLVVEAKKRKQIALTNGHCMFEFPAEGRIDQSLISPNALNVIKDLRSRGFKAYIVGGCVRDLLLGKEPKDFDVTTTATPKQIVGSVRHCRARVIGRRFKIVHCVFGTPGNEEIIEVATFRSKYVGEAADNGFIIHDNNYGTDIVEDSCRRDYTVNSMYYSPVSDTIYDLHGGYYDLMENTIDIIGEPVVRIFEDPARIIRAYRFVAKLGFSISDRTLAGFRDNFSLIKNINNSRLFEEVNKFFLGGYGRRSYEVLRESGILRYFLTEQGVVYDSDFFDEFISESLKRSDERYREGKPNMPAFLYAVLLWPLIDSLTRKLILRVGQSKEKKDIVAVITQKVLTSQNLITNIPAAVQAIIVNILTLQTEMEYGKDGVNNPDQIVASKFFRAAVDFLKLRAAFDDALADAAVSWNEDYNLRSRNHEAKGDTKKKQRGRKSSKAKKNAKPAEAAEKATAQKKKGGSDKNNDKKRRIRKERRNKKAIISAASHSF